VKSRFTHAGNGNPCPIDAPRGVDYTHEGMSDKDIAAMLWRAATGIQAAFILIVAVGAGASAGPEAGATPAAPSSNGGVRAAVIPIRGEINIGTHRALERLLGRAQEDGVGLVVLEVDSPGGALDACEEMCRLLRDVVTESRGRIRTVAYVESDAISAAAIISLACQRIVMRHGARIGDAQAILATPGAVEVAPEKVQTYVRSLVRGLAQANGYPELICEAMVDQDLEVYKVTVDGSTRYVTAEELEDLQRRATGAGGAEGPSAPLQKELVIARGKILTLTASEAEALEISSGTVSDLAEAVRFAGGNEKTLLRYELTPPERIIQFLNTMAVTTILLTAGLVAGYVAFKTPGFGAPEVVAIVCFGIFFTSHYLADLADYFDMILFVVGAVLLAVEIFVTPGFGFMGVGGIVCIVASLVLAMQRFVLPDPHIPFQVRRFTHNLMTVFLSVFFSLVAFMVLLRYLPRSVLFKPLRLEAAEGVEAGYVVESAGRRDLVGRRGVALTTLRPVGRAEIDGETVIVVADRDFIEAGEAVVVQEVAANRVVVRKA